MEDCTVTINFKGGTYENTKEIIKNAVTAGVLIALYFVTYLVIGAISMPVPVLFLLMPMLVALLASTNLSYASCKDKVKLLLL